MPLIPADLYTSCLSKRNKIMFQLLSPSIFYITKQEFSLLLDSAVSGELFVWACWRQLFSHQTKEGQKLTSNIHRFYLKREEQGTCQFTQDTFLQIICTVLFFIVHVCTVNIP